jgi:preprotein translocase subunit SecF
MEFIRRDLNIDFVGKRRMWVTISVTIILIGLLSIVLHGGLKYGLDFTGGDQIQLHFENPEGIGNIRNVMSSINLGASEVKIYGEPNDILVTFQGTGDIQETQKTILTALSQRFSGNIIRIDRVEHVSAKVGGELRRNAVIAVLISMFFMIFYIGWRFDFRFGLGAILALFHDVLITIGVFSVLNKEITLTIVAALLTIVGYSINDTIIICDRIRENMKVMRRENFLTIINKSINQTLSRTIITSGATLLSIVVLFFAGSEVVRDFSFAMIVGIITGTYSSVYIATPLVIMMEDWKARRKKIRQQLA